MLLDGAVLAAVVVGVGLWFRWNQGWCYKWGRYLSWSLVLKFWTGVGELRGGDGN